MKPILLISQDFLYREGSVLSTMKSVAMMSEIIADILVLKVIFTRSARLEVN